MAEQEDARQTKEEPQQAAVASGGRNTIYSFIAGGIVIGFLVWFVMSIVNQSAAGNAELINEPYAETETYADPQLAALQQLHVKQWSFVETRGRAGETTYEVSGELENPTGNSYQGVYLAVALYDAGGNIVATSTVHASNVQAGGIGLITGYVIDKTSTKNPTGEIQVSSGF